MIRQKLIRATLLAALSVLLVTPVLYAAPDPYSPTVTISVTPPDGKTQTLDVRESDSGISEGRQHGVQVPADAR